jgi:hypothetical protein
MDGQASQLRGKFGQTLVVSLGRMELDVLAVNVAEGVHRLTESSTRHRPCGYQPA